MGFLNNLLKPWSYLPDMFFPRVCCVCHTPLGEQEDFLCLHCLVALPRTNMHLSGFNAIHQRLAGHNLIERAGAWFQYVSHSEWAQIIYDTKYYHLPLIGRAAGKAYAAEIKGDGFFDGVDLLLPVPMWPAKERRRGYNQAREIARGMSEATGITVGDNLRAVRSHSTQTRRHAWERFVNAHDTFGVSDAGELNGKHVMIVDDVITTGATMLACCDAIRAVSPATRLSVIALGATVLR